MSPELKIWYTTKDRLKGRLDHLATHTKKRVDVKKWFVRITCLSIAVLMIGLVVISSLWSGY